MANTGTYDISTLLATTAQSAKQFGVDTIATVLRADLEAHNAIVDSMIAELCEVTTDALRVYGASSVGVMADVDEYGRAASQVVPAGATVGFPLRLKQYAVGWTAKFLETATPSDLAKRQLDAEVAHKKAITLEMQRAIFRITNYTFNDYLVDNVDLAVKRFVNADSMVIPNGPNGEEFAGASHDHYYAESSEDVDDYLLLISTVVEHGHGGSVKLCINKASEATVRGYTGFVAYADPRLVYPSLDGTNLLPGSRLDISRIDNRAIGLLGAAEVWVKSWIPANYAFCYDAADRRKPLAFRQRSQNTLQGLRLAAEIDTHPLQAQYFEAEFGIGVWTRTNGSVLYIASDTWADAL